MEKIQQTLEQMSKYMNIIALISVILLFVFCSLILDLFIVTIIESIKDIRNKKTQSKEPEDSNYTNDTNLSLIEKEKPQSEDCDLKNS